MFKAILCYQKQALHMDTASTTQLRQVMNPVVNAADISTVV